MRLDAPGQAIRVRWSQTAREMERSVLPLFEDGRLRVPVSARYPLDRAEEAYERFAAGGKLGKIVLEMTSG